MSKASELVGKTLNGYLVLTPAHNKPGIVNTRCVKCSKVANKDIKSIEKKVVRCKGCKPSATDIYLNDVRDLMEMGIRPVEIAKILGCSYITVQNLSNLIKTEEDYISLDEPEYTFTDIAKALGISDKQAKAAYDSGLQKIKCMLEPMDDFKDYTEAPEQAVSDLD